ncbi:hypothetical protein [uncultured Paraglaciecola sp.]|uniref:hypothetical protein n=1 Tax=uncultured Paraglaciecola sp. TaxID=1765024 RepID=UPI0026364A97|nr:hypothetical protein [uncultured Paraglaciecola sp.]
MADTVPITLTKQTWTEINSANNEPFTISNASSYIIWMRAKATEPTGIGSGHPIYPGRTGGRITTGKHWIYSDIGGSLAFTPDDRA